MQETQSRTPEPSSGDKGLSWLDCVLLWMGILGTGTFLSWLGGGFPPLVWRQFLRLQQVLAPSQPQFVLLLAQGAFLLAAWGLLLILTLRMTWDCRHLLPARRARQHVRGQRSPDATDVTQANAPQDMHAGPTRGSVPLYLHRASGAYGQHEDKAQDSSRPLQGEDAAQRAPWWLFQPALCGEPVALNAFSCHEEGTPQKPSTAAYLLTDIGGTNSAAPSRPVSFFAIADRLPCEEPAYTTICLAIEAMRDTVMQACSGTQALSDHALATLLEEQVQHVTRIIGQQSLGDETLPAVSASLIIGSTMLVANRADTRAYVCRSPNGFSQVTGASGDLLSFNEESSSAARQGSLQPRGKRNERRKSTPRTPKDHPSAVPLAAGDTVLLCSDGVWSLLHAPYLEQIIRSAGPDSAAICAALLVAARKSGSTDPMSMIVVRCL
jgi:serine/threonine protein phosphatase PrpC